MKTDEKIIMDASTLLLDNEFLYPMLQKLNMIEIEKSPKGGKVITMIQDDSHKWDQWTIDEIKHIVEIHNQKPAPKKRPGVTFSKKVFLACMLLSGWLIVVLVKAFQWLSHFF